MVKKRKYEKNVNWGVKLFRLTLFPKLNFDLKVDEIWEKLLDSKPDSRNFSPNSGEFRLVGDYEKGILELIKTPVRIDFVYRTKQDILFEEDGSLEFTNLGSLENLKEGWLNVTQKFIEKCSDIKASRLAFGAILVNQVPNREVGYKDINSYLKLDIEPGETENFMFQINKPIEAKTNQGIKINRLTKWAVLRVSPQTSDNVTKSATKDIFLSNLELDINTKPESSSELTKVSLTDLFRELVSIGQSISKKGI